MVCIDGWHETVWAYARQYHITKLKHIVSGGKTGQESICNGIMELAKHYGETDLISIHDAIRPMVSAHIISENLAVCRQYGGAITAISCAEEMCIRYRMRAHGVTILFVSHSIEQVQRICHRALWLDHGHLKMIGPVDEVCPAYISQHAPA